MVSNIATTPTDENATNVATSGGFLARSVAGQVPAGTPLEARQAPLGHVLQKGPQTPRGEFRPSEQLEQPPMPYPHPDYSVTAGESVSGTNICFAEMHIVIDPPHSGQR